MGGLVQYRADYERCRSDFMSRAEARLRGVIASRNPDTPEGKLDQAMRYALEGGKKFRALMVWSIAGIIRPGSDVKGAPAIASAALDVALAVEMAHCYSLVHDDLPAMDNDDERRGKPTVHKIYGEATAILVGDALLTRAFELLAHAAGSKASGMIRVLASAIGDQGMIAGQMLDLAGAELDSKSIRRLYMLKTGKVFQAAAELGAWTANAELAAVESFRNFANYFGEAWQIQDDLLDEAKKSEKPGITALMPRPKIEAWRDRLLAEAENSIKPFGEQAFMLRAMINFARTRPH